MPPDAHVFHLRALFQTTRDFFVTPSFQISFHQKGRLLFGETALIGQQKHVLHVRAKDVQGVGLFSQRQLCHLKKVAQPLAFLLLHPALTRKRAKLNSILLVPLAFLQKSLDGRAARDSYASLTCSVRKRAQQVLPSQLVESNGQVRKGAGGGRGDVIAVCHESLCRYGRSGGVRATCVYSKRKLL